MSKPVPHKRPSLGPLEKPAKKRFTIDPNTKVLVKQIAIGVAVFTSVALVIVLVWYVTRLQALTISTVTVTGGETIDIDTVRSLAEHELEGAYGKLIPKRFFAFYPQGKVLQAVSGVDRIKDVFVDRVSRTELAVTFGEYTPFALWCKEEDSEECLFIDERGYAFGAAPQLSGGGFIRYRSSAAGPEIGKSILSPEDFWSTVTFIKLSELDKRYIRSIEVDSARDVYYELVGGSELRAALAQPPETVVDNARTIFNSKEFAHLHPGNFNYIDLRFGNKVYVNEHMETTAAASSTISSAPIVLDPAATVTPAVTTPAADTEPTSTVIIHW